MLANPEAVTRRVTKFGLGEGDGVLHTLGLGLADFATATIAFLALLVVVLGAATVRAGPRRRRREGRGTGLSPS